MILYVHAYNNTGGSVEVLFAESDATGLESTSLVEAPVSVRGDNTESLTVIVVPLTIDMYLANPGMYRNSCDHIITDAATHNTDSAEGKTKCMHTGTSWLARGGFHLEITYKGAWQFHLHQYPLIICPIHISLSLSLSLSVSLPNSPAKFSIVYTHKCEHRKLGV